MPLPPPVHGSAVVSRQIRESPSIREAFDCDFVNLSTSRSLKEVGKGAPVKALRFLGSFLKTFLRLLTHRYDLCYLAITCHGHGFLKDAPFVLLCRMFRRKVVIHQHNKGMSGDVDRWPYRWLLPLVYRKARVILLSWRLYDDISGVVPRENVLVCPNGIDSPAPSEGERKHSGAVPRILFLSNLIKSKGVFTLLDALQILSRKGYSFQCDFVGSSTKEIDAGIFALETERRGLSAQVSYKGPKYGDEKERVLDEADIFVFPTENETFGLCLLEAMAHRLPVVTTDEGGIPDIVEDGVCGFICEKRNPEALSGNIAKLIEDKGLRLRMGEEGFRRQRNLFSGKAFENRMLECLKESL